jgi:uncharacterized membrane protein
MSKILLILSLVSILILWPILFIVSNPDIWFLIQKRNNVNIKNVQIYDKEISSFFKNENTDLKFLNEKEISHLQDVKKLITISSLSLLFSIILFIPFFLYIKNHRKTILRKVSIEIAIFLILMLILNIFNFNWIFINFHETLFTENYSFPSNSIFKILYPDSFFRDVFILYFIFSILGCLVTLAISCRLKV